MKSIILTIAVLACFSCQKEDDFKSHFSGPVNPSKKSYSACPGYSWSLNQGGLYALFRDSDEKQITEFLFDYASPFADRSYAVVRMAWRDEKTPQKWHKINKDGELIEGPFRSCDELYAASQPATVQQLTSPKTDPQLPPANDAKLTADKKTNPTN